ncbi:HNH endonuclease signature motif containing protein [Variovorax paradoxus]|uniref:HNH endonuclease n=1 Tax=Variovorax paradoxus TaxID=34073 RepID=UPI0030D3080A
MKLAKKLQRTRVLDRDEWTCQYCGARLFTNDEATVDHIIPVSLGGANEDANMRAACKPCNTTKGQRSEQWLRLFLALGQSKYADVITLEQYHRLQHIGSKLEPLPEITFFYERESA